MPDERELSFITTSSAAIMAHQKTITKLGQNRRRAIQSLLGKGWTITEIAAATDVNRQTLYKAATPPKERPAEAAAGD